MRRFPIEQQFTYNQGYDNIQFPAYANRGNNANIFDKNALYDSQPINSPFMFPAYTLPLKGTGHSNRKGDRITVTSLRLKLNIVMNSWFCGQTQYDPFYYSGGNEDSVVLSNDTTIKRFFKMRYMLIQFDDDFVVDSEYIAKWFYSTYCYYKNPADTITDPVDAPISVHSNVMRITTPFTAKFNILTDRCFTLVSNKPSLSLDITVPMHKSYIFDEGTDNLIHPNIWQIILPPLSWQIDVDPITRQQYHYQQPTTKTTLAKIYYWTKLNFVDL